VLTADGLIDRIGPDHIHGNVHRAVDAAQAAHAGGQTVESRTGASEQ
jgi:hypothetical protein